MNSRDFVNDVLWWLARAQRAPDNHAASPGLDQLGHAELIQIIRGKSRRSSRPVLRSNVIFHRPNSPPFGRTAATNTKLKEVAIRGHLLTRSL